MTKNLTPPDPPGIHTFQGEKAPREALRSESEIIEELRARIEKLEGAVRALVDAQDKSCT